MTNVGNSLRLSWDHQLSRDAGHAVLWIKDGQETQRLELDAKQLSEGSVVYWPSHSDVDFRLELLTAGGSVTESIRAIGGPAKAAAAERAPAAKNVKRAAAAVHSRKRPRGNRLIAATPQVPRTLALPRRESRERRRGIHTRCPDGPTGGCGNGRPQGISQLDRARQGRGRCKSCDPGEGGACDRRTSKHSIDWEARQADGLRSALGASRSRAGQSSASEYSAGRQRQRESLREWLPARWSTRK